MLQHVVVTLIKLERSNILSWNADVCIGTESPMHAVADMRTDKLKWGHFKGLSYGCYFRKLQPCSEFRPTRLCGHTSGINSKSSFVLTGNLDNGA